MSFELKVKHQYEHAIGASDPFCRFNLLWISFNCYYNSTIGCRTDRENIDLFKRDEPSKDLFLKFSRLQPCDSFFQFIQDRKHEQGVWGVIDLKKSQVIKYNNIASLCEFVEIIYTIRNNQFHGWKDPESENDNMLLENSANILKEFLWVLYKSNRIIND